MLIRLSNHELVSSFHQECDADRYRAQTDGLDGKEGRKDARGSPPPPVGRRAVAAAALTALTKWPMWNHYGRRKPRRRSLRLWTVSARARERESKRSTQGPSLPPRLPFRTNEQPARPIPFYPTIPPFYCVACQLSVRPSARPPASVTSLPPEVFFGEVDRSIGPEVKSTVSAHRTIFRGNPH